MSEMSEQERLQQDIKMTKTMIERLLRTNDRHRVKNSIFILEKRLRALQNKLSDELDKD